MVPSAAVIALSCAKSTAYSVSFFSPRWIWSICSPSMSTATVKGVMLPVEPCVFLAAYRLYVVTRSASCPSGRPSGQMSTPLPTYLTMYGTEESVMLI